MPQVIFSTNLNLDRTYEKIQLSPDVKNFDFSEKGLILFALKDDENISKIQISSKGKVNIYCKHIDLLDQQLPLLKSLTVTADGHPADWEEPYILNHTKPKLDSGWGYSDSFTTNLGDANDWLLDVKASLLVSEDLESDYEVFDPLFPSRLVTFDRWEDEEAREGWQQYLGEARAHKLRDVASVPAGYLMDISFKNLAFKKYQDYLQSKSGPGKPSPDLSLESFLPSKAVLTIEIKLSEGSLDDEAKSRIKVKLLEIAKGFFAPDNLRFLEMLTEAGFISKKDIDHIFVPATEDVEEYLERFDSIIGKYRKQ